MEHAIEKIENFTRRAQDRLMTLERDMDKDPDVIAYRKVMAHDPENLAALDSALTDVRRLQQAEDDVAAGKVLAAETREWVEHVRRLFYGNYSDEARKHAARCSAILGGTLKNGLVVREKAQHRNATVVNHAAAQNSNRAPYRKKIGFWRGLGQITWWILKALFWLAAIGLTVCLILMAMMSPMMSMSHTGIPGLRTPRRY